MPKFPPAEEQKFTKKFPPKKKGKKALKGPRKQAAMLEGAC